MDFTRALGLDKTAESHEEERNRLHFHINIKLSTSGQPTCVDGEVAEFMVTAQDLLKVFREKNRLRSS